VDHLKLVVEAAMALRKVDMAPVLALEVSGGPPGLPAEERGRVVVPAVLVTTGSLIRLPPKDVLFQMKFVRDV
jgi:hypothetical protein